MNNQATLSGAAGRRWHQRIVGCGRKWIFAAERFYGTHPRWWFETHHGGLAKYIWVLRAWQFQFELWVAPNAEVSDGA